MNKKKLFTIFGALLIMFAFIFSIYPGPARAGGGSLCYGTNNFAAEAAAGDKSLSYGTRDINGEAADGSLTSTTTHMKLLPTLDGSITGVDAGRKSSGDFMEARPAIPLGYFESMPPGARHVFVAA